MCVGLVFPCIARLSRSASLPQKDACQQVENDVDDDHENNVRPEIVLVKVVAIQHLGAFGQTGQLRLCRFAGCEADPLSEDIAKKKEQKENNKMRRKINVTYIYCARLSIG